MRRVTPGSDAAPDMVSPFEAWRCWLVVQGRGRLRLTSVMFPSAWPPLHPTAATCSAGIWRHHPAPGAGCSCGIYAAFRAADAAAYLGRAGLRGAPVVWSVIGVAALWGTVVESERGLRATYAYPRRLYVPAQRLVPARAARGGRPASPQAVAAALAEYGVPVTLLAAASTEAVAEHLPLAA
jgi:hypothetical protein